MRCIRLRSFAFVSLCGLGLFGPLRGEAAVTLVAAVNGASYVNSSLPNGKLAQGALFVGFGQGMGPASIVKGSNFSPPDKSRGNVDQSHRRRHDRRLHHFLHVECPGGRASAVKHAGWRGDNGADLQRGKQRAFEHKRDGPIVWDLRDQSRRQRTGSSHRSGYLCCQWPDNFGQR